VATLHPAAAGLISALMSLGPLPVALLVIAALWWAGSRLVRLVETETRRRPLFVAWLLWHWARRRR
jgi:hypothetical protein